MLKLQHFNLVKILIYYEYQHKKKTMLSTLRVSTTEPISLYTKFGNSLEKLKAHERIEVQAKLCVWSIAVEKNGNYTATFNHLNYNSGEYNDNVNEVLALAKGMNLIEVNDLIDMINKNVEKDVKNIELAHAA
ncbi:hypothetical protein RIVM261_079560 [Rivularia sp. IAM M-261]|nr:hypothetical protein RIVM261_079560 [Rivularia sp. IAM M-261]